MGLNRDNRAYHLSGYQVPHHVKRGPTHIEKRFTPKISPIAAGSTPTPASFHLPEHHTDLVFAAIAEEWGLVGGLTLMLAYFFLLKWSLGVARGARSRFSRLAAMDLTITIFLYIAKILPTATGLTPVMGMPLPPIIHGGSAMLTVKLAMGILIAIERVKKSSHIKSCSRLSYA